MLLVIDVGNTNIVLGVFRGETLLAQWRAQTDPLRTADEYAVLLRSLFAYEDITSKNIMSAVVSSVVPPLLTTFDDMCQRYFDIRPLIIGPGIKTGIKIVYENPREVGADRIVNALAAHRMYGGNCIVIDFGTATTFDALTADGEYLGGAIAPGIRIAIDALFERTAKLPRIDLVRPKAAIGRNTVASMQSGAIFGYVGLVDGLVARFKEEMGDAKVIATGGLARVIAQETKSIDVVDDNLTLHGLRLLHELNHPRRDMA